MIADCASKLLAFAVWRLFPQAKLDGGHADFSNFCYDFYLDQPLNDEMLGLIETEMCILAKEQSLEKKEMMRENAAELFRYKEQPYLAELALKQPSNIVSIVQMADCVDLFEGELYYGVYKILRYHQFEGRTRIYGVAASDKKALKKVQLQEQVDHRVVGKDLQLFTTSEDLPSGSILWLPKGSFVKKKLESWFFEQHLKAFFTPVETPKVVHDKVVVGERVDEEGLLVLGADSYPIPAPTHDFIYRQIDHSYRDLPVRYTELYSSYRPDSHRGGLYSPLHQTKDLSTIYCTEEQVEQELNSSLQFMLKTINMLDLECQPLLRVSQNKKEAPFESWLRKVLETHFPSYDEERVPDGSAIVFKPVGITLSLRYGQRLHYHGADDKRHKPVVLNRILFGSIERLIALLIEQKLGKLPLWLAPEQVRVLTIEESESDYADQVGSELCKAGFRVEVDNRSDPLAGKIHRAEKEMVPAILVVGEKEELKKTVALRMQGQIEKGLKLETVIERLHQEQGR